MTRIDGPHEVDGSYYLSRFRPPFYEYSIRAVVISTDAYRLRYAESKNLPSEFLVAALLYVLLVVRWKPKTPTRAEDP